MANADSHLLFGLIALQNGLVNQGQLVAAFQAWSILLPDFKGEVPEGYFASRSKTWKVVVFVRVVPLGGDVAKAIEAGKGIKVYPLTKVGQPVTHQFIDVSAKAMPLPILTWEDKLDYWRQLHAEIQSETAWPATSRNDWSGAR